jgi:hypothetical protein
MLGLLGAFVQGYYQRMTGYAFSVDIRFIQSSVEVRVVNKHTDRGYLTVCSPTELPAELETALIEVGCMRSK